MKTGLSGAELACEKFPESDLFKANCYAFAINHVCKNEGKLQPGQLSGKYNAGQNTLKNCQSVKKRLECDLELLGYKKLSRGSCKCPPGHYKICLILSPGDDYHFLRQSGDVYYAAERDETKQTIARKFKVDESCVTRCKKRGENVYLVKHSGVWAHKRGYSRVTLCDASGNLIFDPAKANFDYGLICYNKLCQFYCVKKHRKKHVT